MKRIIATLIILAVAGCGGEPSTEFAPADQTVQTAVQSFMQTVLQRVNSVKRPDKFEPTLQSTLCPSLPHQESAAVLARLRKIWGATSAKVKSAEKNSYGQIQATVVFSNRKSEVEITFDLLESEGKLTIAGAL